MSQWYEFTLAFQVEDEAVLKAAALKVATDSNITMDDPEDLEECMQMVLDKGDYSDVGLSAHHSDVIHQQDGEVS